MLFYVQDSKDVSTPGKHFHFDSESDDDDDGEKQVVEGEVKEKVCVQNNLIERTISRLLDICEFSVDIILSKWKCVVM